MIMLERSCVLCAVSTVLDLWGKMSDLYTSVGYLAAGVCLIPDSILWRHSSSNWTGAVDFCACWTAL